MGLPKSMRIGGYKSFDYLYKKATRFHGESMVLMIAKSNPRLTRKESSEQQKDSFRFAISISNKVSKKAVIRNRLRRVFHSYLLTKSINKKKLKSLWALVHLKPSSIDKEEKNLLQECEKLFHQAGLT